MNDIFLPLNAFLCRSKTTTEDNMQNFPIKTFTSGQLYLNMHDYAKF